MSRGFTAKAEAGLKRAGSADPPDAATTLSRVLDLVGPRKSI